MSAVDWEACPEPWRSIGLDWCATVFRLANNGVPQPPSVRPIWRAEKFSDGMSFYHLSCKDVAERLNVRDDAVERWRTGQVPTAGRRLAIQAMFDELYRERS
jgi:hypothetical protein